MQALMMETPLLISGLLRHAARYHGDTEIVSRTVEGPNHRYTYADAWQRSARVANALARIGCNAAIVSGRWLGTGIGISSSTTASPVRDM
jgi:acyl-CoA synthetase (AMP-forming)/AMP-acid ligase II